MRMNRRIATAVALLLSLASLAAAAEGEGASEIAAHLEKLERLGFAGVVVVVKDGEPLVAGGYGMADRGAGIPWTTATVSTIGSITKQFTGAAVLALAEEGRLSTDDPITKYFADVPPDKREITLHQLLTHSSGIVDLDGLDDWDPIERESFVRRAMEQRLAFEPGAGYEYSNAGYSLLAAIVEQLTGGSYESFLRHRLLLPSGMFETGYLLPRWGEDRLAQGYQAGEPWGTVLGRPMAEDGPYWVLRGNGGIHSTAWDMVRWAEALLDGRVLSAESMERYWTPFVDEGGGDSFYGYGWVVMDAGGSKVVTHNGGNGIFFADMAIVPDARLIVFLMTNVVSQFPMANQLLGQIGPHLLAGEPLPPVPDVVDADAAALAPLAGRYAVDGGGAIVATVVPEGLNLEADDPRAFALLLSSRPADLARAERLSGRIEAIAEAFLDGDFGPLWEAYGRPGREEDLAAIWRSRLEALVESNGPRTGWKVLGTAARDGRDVTLLRLDHRDGPEYRAFVWDPDEEETLLGVSQRGLDPVLHVRPLEGGGYASWDGRSGTTLPVEIARGTDGVTLRIGAPTSLSAVKDD